MKSILAGTVLGFCLGATPAQAFDLGGLAGDVLDGMSKTSDAGSSTSNVVKGIEALSLFTSEVADEEEVAIGREIAGRLLGAAPLVKDDRLQNYVNSVGSWVASQSERTELQWTFGVIDSESVNAFAAPGGYIFITSGLYKLLNNESELAGVLGHEIGHVLQRHHLELLNQSKLIDTGSQLLSQNLRNRNEVVNNLIGNGAEVLARGLDKDAEYEADLIGVILAARAGYDSYGLPVVLQQIGHSASAESTSLLYKTHPSPGDRLENLHIHSEALPDQGEILASRFYQVKP